MHGWLVVLWATSALAQTPAGSIVGRVSGPEGASLAGARVEIAGLEGGDPRQAVANGDGEFVVLQLPPGAYRLTASHPGFRTVERSRFELQSAQTSRVDFQLVPGDPSEKMVIAMEEMSLDTQDADIGETAGAAEIEETPLEGRDFQNLAFQSAGVLKKSAGGTGSNFSINGARSDNTNFLLDGFNNRSVRGGGQQIRVPIDAMQEFRMQSNTYSAEHGRFGGGVMNVVLRGGTNRLHGTVFEFLRNDAVDARNFFAAERTKLRRNQFGATANGPVFLPRLYDGRNRTYFLFSWESYRQRKGATRLTRTPTELERAGDFSQTLETNGRVVALRDPLASGNCNQTGQGGCFPQNRVPRSRWNAISEKVLPYYPLPNNPSVNNYTATGSDKDDWDSYLAKVDHKLSASDSLAVRFARRPAHTTAPFGGSAFAAFGDRTDNRQHLAGANWVRTIRPSLVNDARLGLVRTYSSQESFMAGENHVQALGITGVVTDRQFWGFPRFTVRDLGALGDPAANPTLFVVSNWQAQESVTWLRSRHTLKFGAEAMLARFTQDANNNLRGTFNFLGRWTNAPFADYLLGYLNNSTRQVGFYRNYLHNNVYGFFAQDDWRAARTLTVNLGLRYERYYPPEDKYGRWTNYVPELGRQVVSSSKPVPDYDEIVRSAGADRFATADQVGLPSALVYPNTRNLAPRVGVAWRPFGSARTVVRAGYGIFFQSANLAPIRGDLGAAFPFLVKQTFTRNANQTPLRLTLSDPFPEALKTLTDVNNSNGYQVRPRAAYLQAWNYAIEREFSPSTQLEAAYMGSKGTHLGRRYDVNQPFRSAGLQSPYPRPYPGFNIIQYYAFGSNSSFHSAVLTLRRRFAGGGMLRAHYTLSKSIDDSSQISGSGDGGYGGAQDARNLRLERGRSDWDVRHAVSANANYELPWKPRHGWLGGWRISGTTRLYTGQPFTPQVSDVQLDQGEANRPDRVAFGTLANPTPERWFDLSAFPTVPTGAYRFGNSGRNILNGPGTIQVNTGLHKIFPAGEGRYLQLRVEAFNVLNHANFDLPNLNVDAVNGGTITQADEGRLIQFALKFVF